MSTQTEQEREFLNPAMKKRFEDNDTELFSVKCPNKAAILERFKSTLKSKIWRMSTSRNNHVCG